MTTLEMYSGSKVFFVPPLDFYFHFVSDSQSMKEKIELFERLLRKAACNEHFRFS